MLFDCELCNELVKKVWLSLKQRIDGMQSGSSICIIFASSKGMLLTFEILNWLEISMHLSAQSLSNRVSMQNLKLCHQGHSVTLAPDLNDIIIIHPIHLLH